MFLFLILQLGWCNRDVRSESGVSLLTGVYLTYRSNFMIQEVSTSMCIHTGRTWNLFLADLGKFPENRHTN